MLDNKPKVQNEIQIRFLKAQQRDFELFCKSNLKEFYNNWYFYTEYKNKLKDSFPFEIKYVSL